MKKLKAEPKAKPAVSKRISLVLVAAVTGQAKASTTILVLSLIALVLLAYVSTQIYAGILFDDIARLKQEKRICRETLNTLTSDHVSLASRERVADYCENVLKMVRANGEDLELVAVKQGAGEGEPLLEFSESEKAFTEKFSSTLLGVSEVPKK